MSEDADHTDCNCIDCQEDQRKLELETEIERRKEAELELAKAQMLIEVLTDELYRLREAARAFGPPSEAAALIEQVAKR